MNGNSWKIISFVLGFFLTISVALIALSYNGLVKADDKCTERVEVIEKKAGETCSEVAVHNARIQALETNRQITRDQLTKIENLTIKTATIVERLEKKIDQIDQSNSRYRNNGS